MREKMKGNKFFCFLLFSYVKNKRKRKEGERQQKMNSFLKRFDARENKRK